MRRIFRRTPLLLALATAVIVPPNTTSAADVNPKIEVAVEGASVPMLDIGGRPVVEVTINGKGPFPFILDTGAMFNVIDSGLSDELSPSSTDRILIKGFVFGSIKVTDLEAVFSPVTAMFGKVDKPPRGVLSAQSFPGYLLTLDYPRKKITLRKGALPEADARTIFSYGADERLPIMPVKVAGREVKVHLDTGAPFSVSLPTKYKDQLPLTAPAQQKGKARTHVGDFPIFQGTVDGEIEIGEFKLPSCEISFTDVVPHPGATPQGQLGYAALRDFVVTLDSANRRIQFARWRTGAEIKPAPTRADECSVWLELQQLHPRSNTCGRFFSENDASWSGLRCARWNDSLFAGINIARELERGAETIGTLTPDGVAFSFGEQSPRSR